LRAFGLPAGRVCGDRGARAPFPLLRHPLVLRAQGTPSPGPSEADGHGTAPESRPSLVSFSPAGRCLGTVSAPHDPEIRHGEEITSARPPAAEGGGSTRPSPRSEEHTSELQSRGHLVCRLLLDIK